MIKEPGVFSQRYLMRKSKENAPHPARDSHANPPNNSLHQTRESIGHGNPRSNKENSNHLNAHHHPAEQDFPLAYTSAKTHSRERTSVSANRRQDKRNQTQALRELEEKAEAVGKLQRELKESREQTRKLAREAQAKYSQYDAHIEELKEELREKEQMLARASLSLKSELKGVREEQGNVSRYRETIKGQIYWLLGLFKMLDEKAKMEDVRNEVSAAFLGFKEYISEFAIEKELQAMVSYSSQSTLSNPSRSCDPQRSLLKNAADSIFTEDLEEVNMIKIMELQPLIETFNNQHYCAGQEEEGHEQKMERVTKRLFSESKFVGDSNNCSLMEDQRKLNHSSSQLSDNQFLPQPEQPAQQPTPPPLKEIELPCEVTIIKTFQPDSHHENYIKLKKGERLKLLRRIRDQLWIGEVGEKIGLVSQECFQLQ